jgi:ribonuclease R
MEKQILKLLGDADYTPANVPEMLRMLSLPPNQQQKLQREIKSMVTKGLILRTKGNRYIKAQEADLIPGVIQITRGGRGFVQPDEAGIGEIGIPESGTDTAMHGDRVLVRLNLKAQGLNKAAPGDNTGKVVRVLERKRSQFVGTLQQTKQYLFVKPDDPRLPGAVMVPPPRDVGRKAVVGDKVVVELTAWESPQTPPEGEVIEVLGAPDAEGVDMLSVIRHYDLELHFPKNVLNEANTIAKSRPDNQPSAAECAERVDCRSHNVVTIDPDDAKDFDDAICIQKHEGGQWRLWVHIADVSHYVKPGSHLDVEARKRGNSTYLVDRVIPMLPEALSNELCSLKPDVDRLTKCVEFVLSREGNVVSSKFYSAVIRSKKRFTYKEAFAVIGRPPVKMKSSRCCTTRIRWRSGSGSIASRMARSTSTFPRTRSASTITARCCASSASRTTSRTSSSRNTCCWPTKPSQAASWSSIAPACIASMSRRRKNASTISGRTSSVTACPVGTSCTAARCRSSSPCCMTSRLARL